MTATARRDSSLKTCACANYYAEESIDGDTRIYGTGCLRQTNNLFAQGHDAKLVSFLVKAELNGDDIRWHNGGTDYIETEAVKAAAFVSQALAAKAGRAVRNALDKLAASGKLPQQQPKAQAPKQVAVQPAKKPEIVFGRETSGKVGRWTYEGTELTDGRFTYTTGSGETKTAAPGKWTKIEK